MSADDHAIIVGIDHYHGGGLKALCGCHNDAESFRKWLQADVQVPPGQIKCVLSSKAEKTPNKDMIEDEFLKFIDEFRKTKKRGRRLYMFFSGHGIELADLTEDIHVLVLMANASFDALGRSVSPLKAARIFHHCAIFDEVVLFVDCCRVLTRGRVPVDFTFEAMLADLRKEDRGKLVFGFGARWSRDSREQLLPDDAGEGHIHRGLFTYALMDGLKSAEDIKNPGYVTGSSLKAYLDSKIPLLSGLSDLALISGDLDLVIGPAKAPRVKVNVTLSRPLDIFQVRHGSDLERPIAVELVQLGDKRVQVELPRGLYYFGFFAADGSICHAKRVALDAESPINVEI